MKMSVSMWFCFTFASKQQYDAKTSSQGFRSHGKRNLHSNMLIFGLN